ncbi:hypothetical protein CCP1ISM_560003 [Azospirillaceae bacterium]
MNLSVCLILKVQHMNRHHGPKEIRYGSFLISDEHGSWNGDTSISVAMESTSVVAHREAIWNPCRLPLRSSYKTAITGMCIWAKYDCMFHFKPVAKGNPGARRSLSNPKDRADILDRLIKGQEIEKIMISKDPFGLYQTKMVFWQAEVVYRMNIQKLYYSLPVEEYDAVLRNMEEHLPSCFSDGLKNVLLEHNQMLLDYIKNTIPIEIEFLYPMRQNPDLTIENSYTWPYRCLDAEIGIEEMEEIRIPYQAMKDGARIPPILLGMLGALSPYYEQRHYHSQRDYIGVAASPPVHKKARAPRPSRSQLLASEGFAVTSMPDIAPCNDQKQVA